MYRVRKNRMKRWKQDRLQNRAVQLGQLLYQHDSVDVDVDVNSPIDDINDIDPVNIYDTMDDSMRATPVVDKSTFLSDAIKRIDQLSGNTKSVVTETDISCALILLKKRHRLSISCIKDILSLLRNLNVPNIPSSWYYLKKQLTKTYPSPTHTFICTVCNGPSTSSAVCSRCGNIFDESIKPNSFLSFSIHNQIERIIHFNRNIFPTRRSQATTMKDICDGRVHQQLQDEIHEPFLTLTLNVDGIRPNKGGHQSIWPILMIINEIPLKSRFAIENVILAGVWPGPTKPSRTEMSLFFLPLVNELHTLEQGVTFSLDNGDVSIAARVFLIGACCDKPAQSVLQFLPEPIAKFGCGRCEAPGFMVKTENDGNVRSFAMAICDFDQIELRSNMRYDLLLNLKLLHEQIEQSFPSRKRKKLIKQHNLEEKGIIGSCILRQLSYFDVGRGFMADTLHNVYIGCFKRMLRLWFEQEYQYQDWSIRDRLHELHLIFRQLRLPSTTSRIPRCLKLYSKFKANEMRVLLLFGHIIFKNVLKKKYYNHLLKLVVMMHLSENRKILPSYIDIIDRLGKNFLLKFSKLYSPRHCVSVVHSVIHISDTVYDFGPLHTFTTFNFENELGLLTRINNSTRRHAQELIGNLHLIQEAYCHTKNFTGINTDFANYLSSLFTGGPSNNSLQIFRLRHESKSDDQLVRLLFPHVKIKYYKTLHIGKIRLSTRSYAAGKIADDSNIIFLLDGNECPGRIRSIFTIDDGEPHLLIAYMSNLTPLTCEIDENENFVYPNILSTSTTRWNHVPIEMKHFIEKSVFFQSSNGGHHFMRYPNLDHCS